MAGIGIQKGYLGGYYGTNAWNAKSLTGWQARAQSRALRRYGDRTNDYNVIDQQNEESKLFNLFIQRFKWENLPCREYYLEQTLMFNGIAVGFMDEIRGAMLLPCTIEERNVYNEPIRVRALGLDYNKPIYIGDNYEEGEAVLLYDNPLFFPPYLYLQRTAQITADLNRTCEQYSKGLKTTMLLAASDDNVKTLKMAAEGILENEPYRVLIRETEVKGKKKPILQPDAITQYNSPNRAEQLRGIFAHMVAYRADAMSNYGYNGTGGANKLTYTSEAEVGSGNAIADANYMIALTYRKQFAKELSECWGRDIKVKSMLGGLEPDEVKMNGIKNPKPDETGNNREPTAEIEA